MSKTITLSEFQLIEKMMMVSGSSNDHEALAALRKANAVLSKHKLTWADVLRKVVSVSSTPFAEARPDEDDDYRGDVTTYMNNAMTVPEMFVYLKSRNIGVSFVDSVESFYIDRGFVTQGQKAKLVEMVKEAQGR